MHVFLPTAGTCPAGTQPIYRVFNNRPRRESPLHDRPCGARPDGGAGLARGRRRAGRVVMCCRSVGKLRRRRRARGRQTRNAPLLGASDVFESLRVYRSASVSLDSRLVNVPLQLRAVQDRRRDLLDRLRRRVEHRDPLARPSGASASRTSKRQLSSAAYLLPGRRSSRISRSRSGWIVRPNSFALCGNDRPRQLAVDEIVRRQRKIRGANAELQREIERRRRLAATRDADQDHLRLGEVARRRAVVVRLREVDRLHAREVLVAVGDAVRAAGRVRALARRARPRAGWMKTWNSRASARSRRCGSSRSSPRRRSS